MKAFLFWTVGVVLLAVIGNSIYSEINKQKPNLSALPCQKEVVVYEKIIDANALKTAQQEIAKGAVALGSSVKKSHYMKSRLFDFVDIKKVDEQFAQTLKQYQHEAVGNSRVSIEYYIYENDKKDPGKKSSKAMKYAGYLHVTFTLDGTAFYVVQIDFMDMKGRDIAKRIECAMQTFMHAG